MSSNQLSLFMKSRKCEWLFIFMMFITMLAIGIFTVITVSRGRDTDAEESIKGELISLSFLFRHGARTPTHLQADDPYKNYSWPEGLGGLTRKGKESMYQYGQILRKRYKKYLDHVLVRNVIAESSPVRRCIETSLSVLGGMFPPIETQVWSSADISKQWQPLAVSTVEPKRAYLLGDANDCPQADSLADQTDQLQETKIFLAKNFDFIDRFTQHSGYNATKKWGVVSDVYDALVCEENYFGSDFKWPEWMDKVGTDCKEQMKAFRNFGFFIEGKLGQLFLKLRAGTFLKTLLNRLQSIAEMGDITEENRQVNTYGTHDTVISWILHAIGFFTEQPSFGAGLVIELRKDLHTLDPTVHLYYANVTNNFDIYELSLNESSTFKSHCHNKSCKLVDFAASLQAYLPENIEKECGIQFVH